MAAAPSTYSQAPVSKAQPNADNQQQAPQSVVPFLRGSGKGKYKFFSKASFTLTSSTQDLGPIDIKAYDYMRSVLLTVTTTGTGGASGTAAADAPYNIFTNIAVKQPNGQTMYQVSSGINAYYVQKYGAYRVNSDTRAEPSFTSNGSQSTFQVRIPFELDLRDALGALPNKDAAAPFTLELTANTTSNVYGSSQGTSPTFTVEAWLEAYDQPPTTLDGKSVQTTPPNMNTLQRWTEQNVTLNSGQFDARVRKLGNYIRELIFIGKNSSNVRTESSLWPDPSQIVLDEDVKDNISLADWKARIWETWGYGASGSTIDTFTSGLSGRDTGVFPYQYYCDGQNLGLENVNLYLPTIESEDYLLRGSWGSNASKLTVLVCEVLPQGDIFG